MAVDSIQTNQSVQIEGSSLKKAAGSRNDDEKILGEFFLFLLQKISNASNSEDNPGTSPKKEINELLQGMSSPTLQQYGIPDFTFLKEAASGNGAETITAFPENMLSLIDNKGNLTIDNLSEYTLKALEDLQLNSTDSSMDMPNEAKTNDAEVIGSILKQYSAIKKNMENDDGEGIDFSQTDKNALAFSKTNDTEAVDLLQDNKISGNKTSYSSNEQNQLSDALQTARPKALTDEKSSVLFKVPDMDNGVGDLNFQTLSPVETPQGLPKTLELSQDNIEKLARSFKTLRLPDSTELSVKLTPEELGEVTVRVVLEKGRITGHITAGSRDVALMLENKLDLLKQEIANKNVNLSDISVSVFTGQGDGNNRNSSREFLNKHGHRLENTQGYIEEAAIIKDDEHDTSLNIIA